MDAARASRLRVRFCLLICVSLSCLGSFSYARSNEVTATAKTGPARRFYLFHASVDEVTLEEKIEDHSLPEQQPRSDQAQEWQPFIERIDFEGNRRIRRDTLQARIFTRVGDPYNEETLRRDFQALWNTQFFEDVKLDVQDSPDKPNGKIIVFI